MKKRNNGKSRTQAKRREKNKQNKIAMISITFVVCVLFAALMLQSVSLRVKIADSQEKQAAIKEEMEAEEKRIQDIEDMKAYMETDEYAEETAREKLGLVKDNEIVFKEE